MDLITQGLVGATAAACAAPRERMIEAAAVGAFAGMAPDADVFIRSNTDPLLFLEYHRSFTHSFAFIPVGAVLCTLCTFPVVRRWLSLRSTLGFCLAGYGTHALLDLCTSYGTQVLWPFSDVRFALNWISVVDPSFSLPALVLLVAGLAQRRHALLTLAPAWMALYMTVGWVQHERAQAAAYELAASRGHAPATITVKPGFGNLLLWKLVYVHGESVHVDALRAGWEVSVHEGGRAEKLQLERHFPWLNASSQQARDVERFRLFSNDHLVVLESAPDEIIDVRYSMLPNEIAPMWGIRLRAESKLREHVEYFAVRDMSTEMRRRWVALLFADQG